MSSQEEEDLIDAGTAWYQFDLTKPSHMIRCVKKLEFIFRKTMTYDSWQRRTKFAIKDCPMCGDSFELAKPETHHHPETLFDVVERTLQYHIDKNDIDEMTDLQIIEEIADQHFNKSIRYIVLCDSCHKKYHASFPEVMKIIDKVQKDQEKFISSLYKN